MRSGAKKIFNIERQVGFYEKKIFTPIYPIDITQNSDWSEDHTLPDTTDIK